MDLLSLIIGILLTALIYTLIKLKQHTDTIQKLDDSVEGAYDMIDLLHKRIDELHSK